MQKLLIKYLNSYETYHQNTINRILHYIGIPLIYFSMLLIFNWIHIRVPNFFDTSLAWLLIILLLSFYFFLDIIFAATLTVVFLLLNLLAAYFGFAGPSWLSFQIFLVTFIIGLGLIILGHLIENKRLFFTNNLMEILIAPLCITAAVYFRLGYRKDLHQNLVSASGIGGNRQI